MVNDAHDSPNHHDSAGPGAPVASAAAAPGEVPGAAPGKRLSPEARRALEEAEARRQAAPVAALAPEIGGRNGEEPTRYGDWERKGLAVDF